MSARCPACRRPASAADRPFCSRACRDRDLLRWLGEGYRIPGPPADPGSSESGVDKAGDPD